jgi:hypothetical protein
MQNWGVCFLGTHTRPESVDVCTPVNDRGCERRSERKDGDAQVDRGVPGRGALQGWDVWVCRADWAKTQGGCQPCQDSGGCNA